MATPPSHRPLASSVPSRAPALIANPTVRVSGVFIVACAPSAPSRAVARPASSSASFDRRSRRASRSGVAVIDRARRGVSAPRSNRASRRTPPRAPRSSRRARTTTSTRSRVRAGIARARRRARDASRAIARRTRAKDATTDRVATRAEDGADDARAGADDDRRPRDATRTRSRRTISRRARRARFAREGETRETREARGSKTRALRERDARAVEFDVVCGDEGSPSLVGSVEGMKTGAVRVRVDERGERARFAAREVLTRETEFEDDARARARVTREGARRAWRWSSTRRGRGRRFTRGSVQGGGVRAGGDDAGGDF